MLVRRTLFVRSQTIMDECVWFFIDVIGLEAIKAYPKQPFVQVPMRSPELCKQRR